MANRKRLRGQRCIGKPSDVGSVTRSIKSIGSHQAEIKKQATKSGHPETESVQTGKSHIPPTNHERHKIVDESEHEGHDHEEDHGGSVHGEQPVKDLGCDKTVVRT